MSDGITDGYKMSRDDFMDHEYLKRKHEEAAKKVIIPKKAHGDRYNDGKLKWSYVHFGSLEPMVRVLMFGAQKYAPFNWQKGLKKDEILESMQRHLAKMIDGEVNDPESGLPHMGHIQCNAMFYNYMISLENNTKNDTD